MSHLPDGWRFIDYKTVDEYTKISYIQCDRFIVAVYEDEFGVRHEYFCPADPDDTKRPHEDAIPGTHCTPELMADIILDTYKHFLPNHRCNDRMLYDGFQVSENTRKNRLRKCAEMLAPIQGQLKKDLFKIRVLLNIDET